MPINPFQQELAQWLMGLGSWGNELWFALGSIATGALALLAFLPLLRLPPAESKTLQTLLSDRLFVTLLMLMLIVLRLPNFIELEQNPDESSLLLSARTLLHSPFFWISAEMQAIGPISTFAVALPGLFGFPVDYTSLKFVTVAIWCVTFGLMFAGLRRLYGGSLARILILPLAVVPATATYWDYLAYNGEHMAFLLLALAFYVQVRLFGDTDNSGRLPAFLLGVILAMVPFAKIQAAPIALVWGVFACWSALKEHPNRLTHHLLGVAAFAAFMSVYLLVGGALYDFWQSYVLNNLLYASVGWNATQQDVTFLENLLRAPQYFLAPPDSRGLLLLGLVAVLASIPAAIWSEKFRRAIRARELILGGLLCVAAIFAIVLPKNNWTHYLVLFFIPLAMVIGTLVKTAMDAASTTKFKLELPVLGRISHGLVIGTAVVLAAVASAEYNLLQRNMSVHKPERSYAEGQEIPPVTDAVLRHAGPHAAVAIWGVRFADICRAGVRLGTREAQNERALYASRQRQYYEDRWIGDVLARKPQLVVDTATGGPDGEFDQFRLANFPGVMEKLLERYELVEDVDGFHFYAPRSTGQGEQLES